jgi:hypothetical protein
MARDTPFGVATITTRSTAPISMPISRLVEQTTGAQFTILQPVLDLEPHASV